MEIIATNKAEIVSRTNEQLVDQFILFCDIKETSQKTYRTALRSFIGFVSNANISQIERQNILDYKQQLKSDGLSVNSINIRIKVVKRFFQYLEYTNQYKDITKGIKLETVAKGHKRDFLTTQQIRILLNNIDSARDRLIVLLASVTGLRVSEIANLKIKDVCYNNGVPVLMVLRKARSEKEALVISTQLFCDLMKYTEGRNANDPIFCNERLNTPTALTGDHISKTIKAYFKKIGLNSNKYVFHSLRHSAITNALLNGASLSEVQQMAGHVNITTTMTYNHELEASQNKAVSINYDALLN